MNYRWIGSLLILGGCGGFGFAMSAAHRKREFQLRQLIHALIFMESELQYRLTPLPELCRKTSAELRGELQQVFLRLAKELDRQIAPDVCSCMNAAVQSLTGQSACIRKLLLQLGHTLGRFDLQGQVKGLRRVREDCREELSQCIKDRDTRMRSYQTLGLCAGAALAIILA